MKFLHTADLQIGARFTQFGAKAGLLRAARLTTLGRILEIARENAVDAVLIAGDMFESNQIANSVVEEAFAVLAARPEIPVVILPGNHDPLVGPGCVWMRQPFANAPAHVTVCVSRDPVPIADAVILPVPITQKISAKDPSLPLVEMAAQVAPDGIKIGMTHGALAIEGKHQPNDQPIALDAATRAGLDYLALGHWHKPQAYDDGRLAMSGTPEPDDFSRNAGSVSLVEIAAPGQKPVVARLDSATLSWRSVTVDLLDRQPTFETLAAALAGNETSWARFPRNSATCSRRRWPGPLRTTPLRWSTTERRPRCPPPCGSRIFRNILCWRRSLSTSNAPGCSKPDPVR